MKAKIIDKHQKHKLTYWKYMFMIRTMAKPEYLIIIVTLPDVCTAAAAAGLVYVVVGG